MIAVERGQYATQKEIALLPKCYPFCIECRLTPGKIYCRSKAVLRQNLKLRAAPSQQRDSDPKPLVQGKKQKKKSAFSGATLQSKFVLLEPKKNW